MCPSRGSLRCVGGRGKGSAVTQARGGTQVQAFVLLFLAQLTPPSSREALEEGLQGERAEPTEAWLGAAEQGLGESPGQGPAPSCLEGERMRL